MSTESRLIALVEQVGADYKALNLSIGDKTALKTTAKTNLVAAINELFDRPSGGGGGVVIDDTDYQTPEEYPADKVLSAFKVMSDIIGLYEASNSASSSIVTLQNRVAVIIDDASWGSAVFRNDRTVSAQLLKSLFNAQTQDAIDKVAALRSELTAGASSALDTFQELAAALNNDPSFATTLATQMSKRLRFDDAQSLTTAEKLQACENLGIGNPEVDLLAAYTAAKA